MQDLSPGSRPVSPVTRLYPVVIIGYMSNNLLPARLGELVRSYYLAQREGVSGSSALATIAVERVYDGVTLLALKRYSEAASECEEAYATYSAVFGEEHESTTGALKHVVSCYDAWLKAEPDAGREQKAEDWRQKLEAVKKSEPTEQD